MGEHLNLSLVFLAGLASVLSPCVLPIVPIVVTGGSNDRVSRPVMIVAGLALTFMTMGVLSSLFGAIIGPGMIYVEKVAGALIALFGVLLIFNVNPFKHLGFFSRFAERSRGNWGGFFLGATLGVVWIPCVGPMLSGVLTMVATQGKAMSGAFYLLVYTLGFSVPILIAGYASHFFRNRFRGIGRFPFLVNLISGILLVALGSFILWRGMAGFGF